MKSRYLIYLVLVLTVSTIASWTSMFASSSNKGSGYRSGGSGWSGGGGYGGGGGHK